MKLYYYKTFFTLAFSNSGLKILKNIHVTSNGCIQNTVNMNSSNFFFINFSMNHCRYKFNLISIQIYTILSHPPPRKSAQAYISMHQYNSYLFSLSPTHTFAVLSLKGSQKNEFKQNKNIMMNHSLYSATSTSPTSSCGKLYIYNQTEKLMFCCVNHIDRKTNQQENVGAWHTGCTRQQMHIPCLSEFIDDFDMNQIRSVNICTQSVPRTFIKQVRDRICTSIFCRDQIGQLKLQWSSLWYKCTYAT